MSGFENETNLLTNHSLQVPLANGSSIFLGSFRASKSWSALQAANVTGVVNVTVNVPNSFPNHLDYCTLRLPDRAHAPLLQHLDEVTAFIHRHTTAASAASNTNNVLVHCCRGTSRSVAIVWAYLVRYGEDVSEMTALLPKVNPGLLQQVQVYLDGCSHQQQQRYDEQTALRTVVVCNAENFPASSRVQMMISPRTSSTPLLS